MGIRLQVEREEEERTQRVEETTIRGQGTMNPWPGKPASNKGHMAGK